MMLLNHLKLQMVFLDMELVNINLLKTINYLKLKFPATKILLHSTSPDLHQIRELIKIGANGFISNNISKKELDTAIRTLLDNKNFLSIDIQLLFLVDSMKKK